MKFFSLSKVKLVLELVKVWASAPPRLREIKNFVNVYLSIHFLVCPLIRVELGV